MTETVASYRVIGPVNALHVLDALIAHMKVEVVRHDDALARACARGSGEVGAKHYAALANHHLDAAVATRAAVEELITDVQAFVSDHKHGLGPHIVRLENAVARVLP